MLIYRLDSFIVKESGRERERLKEHIKMEARRRKGIDRVEC